MTLATRARATPPRPGFTLIELLVAMAIIAILMALLGVALSKTVESQKRNSTKQQADKLQKSIDAEVNRVVTQCTKDRDARNIPPAIVTFCDNNQDRALAVWTAMKLRQQFPDTFTDALTGVCVTQNAAGALAVRPANAIPGGEAAVFTLKPLATFDEVQGASGLSPHDESAALLYIILAKKSVGGGGAMAAGADDLSQGMMKSLSGNGKSFQAFADAWQNSMGFKRWYEGDLTDPNNPVQAPPFVDVTVAAQANKDPLDPRNLIGGWMDPANAGQLNPKRAQLQALGLFFLDNRNRMTTVYSPGKDKLPLSGGDDIFGFTLRRYGN